MPGLMIRRVILNAALALLLFALGGVFGVTAGDFTMFAVPAVLGLVTAGSTFRMIREYRRGGIRQVTCRCVASSRALVPGRADFVLRPEEGGDIPVRSRPAREFHEGLCYDVLLRVSCSPPVPVSWQLGATSAETKPMTD